MNMTENEKDSSIAKMISVLGKNLKVKVVAEGVETKEQVTMLREYGCHELQGYFYGRPDNIESIEAAMKKEREKSLLLVGTGS